MASWTLGCSGSSNEELVSNLQAAKIITNPKIFQSMMKTDRRKYFEFNSLCNQKSSRYKYGPYADAPQSIGHKVTISAPYIHAIELEVLIEQIEKENSKILDVGCGSGILLGYMGRLAPHSSTLVGIDIVEDLVNLSVSNLKSDGFSVDSCISGDQSYTAAVDQCHILVIHGNGWLGAPGIGPFDAINVGAGAKQVPLDLIHQLKYDGILLIPIGDKIQSSQTLTKYVKRRSSDDGGWFLEEMAIRTVRFVPLVDMPAASTDAKHECLDGVNWDVRYKKGWAYGLQPNQFLVDAVHRFSSRCDGPGHIRCLSLGEGQGRNSVYLASLGLDCTAVDSSKVGLAKAQRLAKQRNVSHRHCEVIADINDYDIGFDQYDIIVSIFFMLPPTERRKVHRKCVDALKDGGIVIIQCFSPRQMEIRSKQHDVKWTVGPSERCLVGCEDLQTDFKELELLHGHENAVDLREGSFHRGRAILTEFVAKKPCASISKVDSNEERGGSVGFCTAMDDIFHSLDSGDTADHIISSPSYIGRPPAAAEPLDRLLQYADRTLQISCIEARNSAWCRYCWSSAAHCFCCEIEKKLSQIQGDSSTSRSHHDTLLHWVMVVHPNEFLRSTSTVKIASRFLERLEDMSCEVLVYGFQKHLKRLDEILQGASESVAGSNHTAILLFPEAQVQATESISEPDSITLIERSDMVSTTTIFNSNDSERRAPGRTVAELTSCGAKENRPKMTIIVPDGTWENARAIVTEIRRKVSQDQLPSFSLNPDKVENHFSPLIETLKEGQGMGRITTLEACALLLSELLGPSNPHCNTLLSSLSLLVKNLKGTTEDKMLNEKCVCKTDERFKKWAAEIQAVAQELPVAMTATPIGLRRCPLCCEYLATPQRMQQHIRGRRHCSVVAHRFLCSSSGADFHMNHRSSSPDKIVVRDVYLKFSTASMRTALAEPPDIATTILTLAIDAESDGSEIYSKGERALQTATIPHIAVELPSCLRRRADLVYDTKSAHFDFYGVVSRLLKNAPFVGHFLEHSTPDECCVCEVGGEQLLQQFSLEDFVPEKDIFRNFKARQVLYNTVSNDSDLLAMYERLVIEVCCPFLKRSLQLEQLIEEDSQVVVFHYQYPPTLRLQSGPSEEHGRPHRDLEYGHQVGEVNFWMPLTDFEKTRTTLWVESCPGIADYSPLSINYGQIGVFHGSLCRHYAPMNLSRHTRVSLDFRIGVGQYFDPDWELPCARGKHTRRKHFL